MNKTAFIVFLSFLAAASVYADDQKVTDVSTKAEDSEKQKQDEQDALFTGVKIQDGNTTISQGEQIMADPSIFHTGKWTPEELAQFDKHVVSSNVNGSVSYSESHSQTSLLHHESEETNQTTTLSPGMMVTSRKDSN